VIPCDKKIGGKKRMDKKILFVIIMCGIIVATLIFGTSLVRYNAGYSTGYTKGYAIGQQTGINLSNINQNKTAIYQGGSSQNGYTEGYQAGYQAGLQAQNNTGT
jgi:flagellar biosynthesis/type III secretory pathway protein FliH